MTQPVIDLPVDDVRVVVDLYPRTETREIDAVIEQYRAAIDDLPPITVARGGVLVDGMHRWQAYRREGRTTIPAVDLGDLTDAEIYDLALEANGKHGRQLTAKEKRDNAARLWVHKVHLDPGDRAAEIARTLSISIDAVYDATKDQRKYEKDKQKETAWDLWLNCETQTAIAEVLDVDQKTVSNWLGVSGNSPKFLAPPGATNERPWGSIQHFDVWNFGPVRDDTAGSTSYFGVMPPQVVENLLWLYTDPGHTVVDPFAGSGTTIDVAKRMGRRVWASDRKPSTPTLPIHEHDITTGWPGDAPKKADLILLDPPYWRQAAGRYSDDIADLGNQSLDEFMASWERAVKACKDHLADGGRVAFIIGPTELKDENRVVDHAMDMWRTCVDHGLTTERRIIVTYSTQQSTGQQVTWARDNRRMLKLYRDLVVMR